MYLFVARNSELSSWLERKWRLCLVGNFAASIKNSYFVNKKHHNMKMVLAKNYCPPAAELPKIVLTQEKERIWICLLMVFFFFLVWVPFFSIIDGSPVLTNQAKPKVVYYQVSFVDVLRWLMNKIGLTNDRSLKRKVFFKWQTLALYYFHS